MEYEFLLRRVYRCGRNYSKGADADIYRSMEHAHHNLETKTLYFTQSEREYQFQKAFATVRNNVRDAIEAGMKQVGSKEAIAQLQDLKSKLTIRFYSKEELDEIIEQADDILRENGLSEV